MDIYNVMYTLYAIKYAIDIYKYIKNHRYRKRWRCC